MIYPDRITDYNRTTEQLEELIVFCVCVAGHNAMTTAQRLDRLFTQLSAYVAPFYALRRCQGGILPKLLRKVGIGCYNKRAEYLIDLINKGLNLRTCSVEDLEKVKGIGPKTARFFVLHSRPNVNDIAVLDTHVLKFMKDHGYDVPKSTPTGKRYRQLEIEFLKLATQSGMSVANFDLMIWNDYRNR
jgi:thermostable 8-oxoguanine DNA glycosylase